MPGDDRRGGILLPLFSLRGAHDWGIGEIDDLADLCDWLAAAGHRLLQLLPIVEMSLGERSPYAALTAFAIDPIYVAFDAVEDFAAAGGVAAMSPADRAAVAALGSATAVDYDSVRAVKRRALERAFRHFLAHEWATGSTRAAAFRRFREEEAAWLADYGLFRACQEAHAGAAWTEWEPALRARAPEALATAGRDLAEQRLLHEYAQWIAAEQWAAARRRAAAAGVRLKGDLPFMVSANSADVWPRREEFHLDLTVGAPPDAFNADGQDWGLPAYRWDAMARNDYAWLRARAARAAELFDVFRLDHVVGYYRMFVIPPGGRGRFVPPDEHEQLALGERLLRVVLAAARGTAVVGEDLGVVPPFVRRSLTALGIPGYRVLRWETEHGVFRDPVAYPALSVATTGTHDTSTLATWWEEDLDDAGRRALAAVPTFAALAGASPEFTPAVHDALLAGLYAAGSDLVVLPFQDAYGGRERINVPATVGAPNWGYRMPWTLRELRGAAGAALRDRLRALAASRGG
ncbi:MAG TPA: 4-alpha-glucanotransferase [Candidatus Binatia bacterium]|nr:4-alpha-glucanotransferase [Candidatus Binatia bacterium]